MKKKWKIQSANINQRIKAYNDTLDILRTS